MRARAWGSFESKDPVMWEPDYIEFDRRLKNGFAPCRAVDRESPIAYENHIVMWESGRHDKDGQPLFEGDIIHTTATDERSTSQ